MDIKSISASRIKTYQHCQFKYILQYMLKECKKCLKTFYTPEMYKDCCPYCESDKYGPVHIESNWGAVHGTALHQIMETYAIGVRGTDDENKPLSKKEKSKFLDWRTQVELIYKRGTNNGQNNPDFAIYDLAKEKDVSNKKKWCIACQSENNSLCEITGETLKEMTSKGCKGCPKNLYLESLELMEKFINRYDPIFRQRKILGIEAPFRIDFGEKDMHGADILSVGFIDLVTELDKDTVEIIDYKFGSFVPSFDEFLNDIQVKLYSLAAKALYPQYKEYIITFDYIRKNPLSIAFTPEEDEETKKSIIAEWKKIAAPQNITRTMVQGNGKDPETSWKCRVFCSTKLCSKEWPIFKEKFGNKE